MLEILQYVTSSFPIFIGSFIFTALILGCTGWVIISGLASLGWALNAILLGIRGKDCGNVDL